MSKRKRSDDYPWHYGERRDDGGWHCPRCGLLGDLSDAIAHSIRRQYRVIPPPKPKDTECDE
jgi:hypothetical protein